MKNELFRQKYNKIRTIPIVLQSLTDQRKPQKLIYTVFIVQKIQNCQDINSAQIYLWIYCNFNHNPGRIFW